VIPLRFHKYIDYLSALRKDPTKKSLIFNTAVATLFTFIIVNNVNPRMAFLYSLVANLMTVSILLTRNQPRVEVPLGMDRKRVVNWSNTAFKVQL
jgi:hypothetical protein